MPIATRRLFVAACVCLTAGGAHAQWDVSGAAAPQYSDPAGRFSLKTPAGWQPSVQNDAVVFQWTKSTVTVFFRHGETGTREMLDAPIQRVRDTATDYRPGERRGCRVGGYDGSTLEFTAKSPAGVPSQGRILTVTNHLDGIAFVLIAPREDFKKDDAALWDAVSTLAFGKKPEVRGPHLAERTPVRLRLNDDVKSGREKKGAPVWFTVVDAVKGTEGNVLVEAGATAYGTVLRSEKRRMFGKPGKLEIGVTSVQAVDGSVVPLRVAEELAERGRSNSDAVAATALLLTPLTVFVKGRDVTIKKGTEIVVYVDEDTAVRPKTASTAPDASAAPAPAAPAGETSGAAS